MRRFPTASILALLASGRVSGHCTGKEPTAKLTSGSLRPAQDIDYDKLAAETFGIVTDGGIAESLEAQPCEHDRDIAGRSVGPIAENE